MTKLKTLCFLMLAVTVCVWSVDAGVQKNVDWQKDLTFASKLDKASSVKATSNLLENTAKSSAKLVEVSSSDNVVASAGRTEETAQIHAALRAELARSSENAVVRQNRDGSYTAAIRGTGTTNCSSVYEMAFDSDGLGPWQAEIGVAYAAHNTPVFYYDISLIPADFTSIVSANVDFHFAGSNWAPPTVNCYFDINDLFTWYDGTNYVATQDDALNATSGNTYAQETAGFIADGTRNYVLDAQAVTDIGTQITGAVGWFGLGLDATVMAIGTESSWMMDPGYGLDTSVLYVTFTAPGENPVVTGVTAVPASQDNIGMNTITFTATWTDVDDHEIGDFGMIFQYRTPWGEEVQLSGGLWEKTGTGTYSWTGEWDPDQDHQIGAHDVRFLIYDGTFTDEFDFTAGDDLFTITSPAIEYADFNTDGPLGQWPAGWTADPVTNDTTGESWQYDFLWTDTTDYIAAVLTDNGTTWTLDQDCTMTSPVVDFSSAATAHLFFKVLYSGTPTTFALEGSLDGFTTVEDSVDLLTLDADSLESLNWNMTDWAAGQANVQIRFHFVGTAGTTSQGVFDVAQFVAGDAAVTVTDTEVAPATTAVIDGDAVALTVDFTGSTTATVDDFIVGFYVQSDVGTQQSLLTGLTNGDLYGTVITENAPGDFTATVGDLVFRPGIEIGDYDLMGQASDTIDWDYDEFTDNEDELELTTPSFWYEDFNDGGATGPTGWSILSLPGGENGSDWYYELYVDTTDYFAYIQYDAEGDAQNEALRTNSIDCGNMLNCHMYYSYDWASGYDEFATGEIRISNDGGSSFTTIYTHTAPADPAVESGLMELDISEYADGENDVIVEFRYQATDDFYWKVNIVQIHEKVIPPIPATGPIGLGLLLAAIGGIIVRRRK